MKLARLLGEYIGICFQIKDDIFDYFDSKEIGKPTGNDMLEGKLTLPVLYALNRANDNQATEIALKVKEGTATLDEIARLIAFTKENGGIFSQTQGWAILAEALMGHGDRAFEYFLESSPANMNDKAEIRVLEPYVHGQFTEATRSPYAGRSHVHWLTGTGSTVMVGCVEGICGMRPNADVL